MLAHPLPNEKNPAPSGNGNRAQFQCTLGEDHYNPEALRLQAAWLHRRYGTPVHISRVIAGLAFTVSRHG